MNRVGLAVRGALMMFVIGSFAFICYSIGTIENHIARQSAVQTALAAQQSAVLGAVMKELESCHRN